MWSKPVKYNTAWWPTRIARKYTRQFCDKGWLHRRTAEENILASRCEACRKLLTPKLWWISLDWFVALFHGLYLINCMDVPPNWQIRYNSLHFQCFSSGAAYAANVNRMHDGCSLYQLKYINQTWIFKARRDMGNLLYCVFVFQLTTKTFLLNCKQTLAVHTIKRLILFIALMVDDAW